jgi:hypothetical protein
MLPPRTADRTFEHHVASGEEPLADESAPLLKVSVVDLIQGYAALISYIVCLGAGGAALGQLGYGVFMAVTNDGGVAVAGALLCGALLAVGASYLALRMAAGVLRGRRGWAIVLIVLQLLWAAAYFGLFATEKNAPSAVQAVLGFAMAVALGVSLRDKSAWGTKT